MQITTNRRHVACGRYPLANQRVQVRRTVSETGAPVAHFAKVQLCGCIWTCPVCGPRIRQERALDVDHGARYWLEHRGAGAVLLLTLTLPHDFGETLAVVLRAVRLAFARLVSGSAWQKDKAAFGLEHYIRSHDVTVGVNGWHPHLHILLFIRRGLTELELAALRRRLFCRWGQAVEAVDRRAPTWEHGVVLEAARSRAEVARYVCQVVAGDGPSPAAVALELTRGDLKTSRHAGQRTPWQVLGDIGRNDQPRDRALWHEWELATRGVHSIRWSKGLRAAVELGAELTDEQLVMQEIGGEVVYTFHPDRWRAVRDRPGALAAVLEAAEVGGGLGVQRYLATLDDRDRVDKAARVEYIALLNRQARARRPVTAPIPLSLSTARTASWRVTDAGAAGSPPVEARTPSPELVALVRRDDLLPYGLSPYDWPPRRVRRSRSAFGSCDPPLRASRRG